jgi:hypothetical protein
MRRQSLRYRKYYPPPAGRGGAQDRRSGSRAPCAVSRLRRFARPRRDPASPNSRQGWRLAAWCRSAGAPVQSYDPRSYDTGSRRPDGCDSDGVGGEVKTRDRGGCRLEHPCCGFEAKSACCLHSRAPFACAMLLVSAKRGRACAVEEGAKKIGQGLHETLVSRTLVDTGLAHRSS